MVSLPFLATTSTYFLPAPVQLTAADHKGIPLLAALDEALVAALRSGAIKLLRAEFLRSEFSEAMLPELLRRQELERRMEEERGMQIFLTPAGPRWTTPT